MPPNITLNYLPLSYVEGGKNDLEYSPNFLTLIWVL